MKKSNEELRMVILNEDESRFWAGGGCWVVEYPDASIFGVDREDYEDEDDFEEALDEEEEKALVELEKAGPGAALIIGYAYQSQRTLKRNG